MSVRYEKFLTMRNVVYAVCIVIALSYFYRRLMPFQLNSVSPSGLYEINVSEPRSRKSEEFNLLFSYIKNKVPILTHSDNAIVNCLLTGHDNLLWRTTIREIGDRPNLYWLEENAFYLSREKYTTDPAEDDVVSVHNLTDDTVQYLEFHWGSDNVIVFDIPPQSTKPVRLEHIAGRQLLSHCTGRLSSQRTFSCPNTVVDEELVPSERLTHIANHYGITIRPDGIVVNQQEP